VDAVLIVDKPAGMTSHDVVARVRRIVGEKSVGHLGTLDPMATGVLPLVLGRFTRLAQFYNEADKRYEGTIRFGWATDTYDAEGQPAGPKKSVELSLEQVQAAAGRHLHVLDSSAAWSQYDVLFRNLHLISICRVSRLRSQPLAQRVQGPDVADAGLVLEERMDVVNNRQSFRRIQRSLRKLDVNVERICAGQFEVKTMAGLDGLFAVRHLLGQPIACLELRVAERQSADDQQADQRVEAGPCHHADCDPPAEPAQNVQRIVHVSDRRDEFGFIADEQDAQQGHTHQNRYQGHRRGDQPGFAERADEVGC